MAKIISTLAAKVQLDNRGWVRASRQVQRSNRTTNTSLRVMRTQMRQTAAASQALSAGFARLQGLAIGLIGVSTIRNLIEFGSEIANTSNRLGIAVEELQRLRFAAARLDLPMGIIDRAFTTFSTRLARLRLDTNSFRTELEALSPALLTQFDAATDAAGAWDVLTEAIRGATKAGDNIGALALSQAAFGQRQGVNLVQVLSPEGQAAAKEASVLNDKQVKELQKANDLLTSMKNHLQVLASEYLVNVLEFAEGKINAAQGVVGKSPFGNAISAANLTISADKVSELQISEQALATKLENLAAQGSKFMPSGVQFSDGDFGMQGVRLELQAELAGLRKELAKWRDEVQYQTSNRPEPPKILPIADPTGGKSNVEAYKGTPVLGGRGNIVPYDIYEGLGIPNQPYLDKMALAARRVQGGRGNIVPYRAHQAAGLPDYDYEQSVMRHQREAEAEMERAAMRRQREVDYINALLEKQVAITDRIREQTDRLSDSVEDGLIDALTGAKTAAEALGGVVRQLLNDLLRQLVAAPLANALAGAIGSAVFGGLAGTNSPAFTGNMAYPITPGRAMGGFVSKGATYMVGERGPELFTAPASGHISPNGAGSQPIVINVNGVNDPPAIRRAIRGIYPEIAKVARGDMVRRQALPGRERNQLHSR